MASIGIAAPSSTSASRFPKEQAEMDSPAGRLLFALHLIERSVLPRVIELNAGGATLYLDVVQQGLQIAPRTGDYYAVDEECARQAPGLYHALQRKRLAARKAQGAFAENRPAMISCIARVLLRHCQRGRLRHRVRAADLEEVVSQVPVLAMDIYRSALDQAPAEPEGVVSNFFYEVRKQALEAWLVTRSGWVTEFPGQVRSVEEIRSMSRTALVSANWASRAGGAAAPSLSFLSGEPQHQIWFVAADSQHVAQMLCTPAQWAMFLSAWLKSTRETAGI